MEVGPAKSVTAGDFILTILIEARLGIRSANYDSSMREWFRDPKLPVEKVK